MSRTDGRSDELTPAQKIGFMALAVLVVLAATALVLTDLLPWYLASILVLVVTAPVRLWLDYRKRRQAYLDEVRAQRDHAGTDQLDR